MTLCNWHKQFNWTIFVEKWMYFFAASIIQIAIQHEQSYIPWFRLRNEDEISKLMLIPTILFNSFHLSLMNPARETPSIRPRKVTCCCNFWSQNLWRGKVLTGNFSQVLTNRADKVKVHDDGSPPERGVELPRGAGNPFGLEEKFILT